MKIINFKDNKELVEKGIDKTKVPVINFEELKLTGEVDVIDAIKSAHPSNLLVSRSFSTGFLSESLDTKPTKDHITYMTFLTNYALFNKEQDREVFDQLVALTKMGSTELIQRISNYSEHDSVRITYNLQKMHVTEDVRREVNKLVQSSLSNKNRKMLSGGVKVEDVLYMNKPSNERHMPLYNALQSVLTGEY